MDQSGKSYYGTQTLHYLDITGQTFVVSLRKEGPIHNTAWVPNDSSLFCVIYGSVPPKTSLFNNKSDVVFEFGEEMRNFISFNRFGNLLALAGIGNLRAGLQIWDLKQKTMISQFKAPETTNIEWCPDGKRILTATTAPRLRVGNGLRIFNYNGICEFECIYDTSTELNEIVWRPNNQFSEPQIEIPKGVVAKKDTEPQKYVPPHLRKTNTNSQNPKPKNSNPNTVVLTESEKKIKNLQKKLQQINDLKELMASGKTLEKNQMQKISKELDLVNELKELQLNS